MKMRLVAWLLVGAFVAQALAWGRHMQSPHPETCWPIDTAAAQQLKLGS